MNTVPLTIELSTEFDECQLDSAGGGQLRLDVSPDGSIAGASLCQRGALGADYAIPVQAAWILLSGGGVTWKVRQQLRDMADRERAMDTERMLDDATDAAMDAAE